MKLVTLNLWGGRVSHKYKEFFEAYPGIDIWCFQEVFREFNGKPSGMIIKRTEGFMPNPDTLHDLKQFLPAYTDEFCQIHKDTYGLASFFKDSVVVEEKGEILVARGNWDDVSESPDKDMHRKLQWLEILIDDQKVLLANVHLTHRPEGKRDSEKRLKQSKIIVDFLGMFDCPKILVGDFNLMPDTESLQMIEGSGLRNLITEHGITSTRTDLYKKDLRFADYVFVSPEIKVDDFKVLPDVVSDHSPVLIDFHLA